MCHMLRVLPAWVCCLVCAASLRAALVYEPFNYPDGPLEGQINPGNGRPWSAMGTDEDDVIVGGTSLTIPGLSPSLSTGKSVSYQGLGKTERLAIGTNITSGSAYFSLVFQVNGYGNLLDFPFGVFFAGLNNVTGSSASQPTTIGTRLLVRPGTVANTFQIGLVKNSSVATDFSFDLTDHALGETVLVVGRYTVGPSAADDTSALWIDPSTMTFGAATAPLPTLTNSAGGDMTNGVRSMLLRQGLDGVPYVVVDELRIDTTWAAVTAIPEPSHGVLFVTCLLTGARRRRNVSWLRR